MVSSTPGMVRPTVFKSFPQLFAAETTRHGGVSAPPFDSLNLGNFTEDIEEHILENRRRVLLAADFQEGSLVFARQVHGADLHFATSAGCVDGFDALISSKKGLLLGVTVADCTPILVFDAVNEVVAAVHAGWKGTVAGIVSKTLAAMETRYGSRGENCFAYIGTCIDECDFEVGEEVAKQFAPQYRHFYPKSNKIHVNLKTANFIQLTDFGIPPGQIEISPRSTFSDVKNYYSFRAEHGKTGRFMGLIGLYP